MAADSIKSGANGSNRAARRSASRPAEPGAGPRAGPKAGQASAAAAGSSEGQELTSVDKKWGVLFDTEGQPTSRFVDAMSSLSRYITDAFLTADSIVLVPQKMASFYNFHTVDRDPFRYQLIFQAQAKGSHRSLAEFYQDLGCAFHLVQASPASPPRIPGLTREGFARWMALQLQAFPDEVAVRLERAISDFPLERISTIDGKSERLPKQLSRYLLPKTPDYEIRALLKQAVKRHFGEAALASTCSRRPLVPRPEQGISCSDGEHDSPRRKPDAVMSEHRWHSSYSSPAPSPHSGVDREPAYGHRGRHESRQDAPRAVSHSRPRQPRRHTEPSRRLSAEVVDDDDESHAQHRRHQHSVSYDGHGGSGRPRSPARSHHHSRNSSSASNSAPRGGRDDARRSRHLPFSLLDALLQPGRSSSARGPRFRVQEAAESPDKSPDKSPDAKPSPCLRRGASPQSRGYRASLPEIHSGGPEYSAQEARGRASESSSRRASYGGSACRGLIDTPKHKNRPMLREVGYKTIGRRDRDDMSYRMYGSSLPPSCLSGSPVLQYAYAAAPRPRDEQVNGSDSDQTWDEHLRASDSQ